MDASHVLLRRNHEESAPDPRLPVVVVLVVGVLVVEVLVVARCSCVCAHEVLEEVLRA